MKEVVIVSAVRTAIGSFGGSLKNVDAVTLGQTAVEGAINKVGLDKNLVDEVFFGCVLQGGQGQGVARQVALKSGLNVSTPATTINMICGSGLKTVSMGVQSILAGDNDVVLVGGTENMSQAPYLLQGARWGQKMGDGKMYDTMVNDGLWDAFADYHMGVTAENIVEKYNFTRDQQDALAVASQNRAEKAQVEGRFKDEIVPVMIPQRRKDPICFDADEYIRLGATVEGLSKLRGAFKKDGSVTAGNASGINDGAAALILMTKEKAEALNLKPLATVASYASAGVDPSIMGTGPIPATKKALKKAKLEMKDIELIEANEAFAAQALSVIQDLDLNTDIVNVNGGAIALGHPIGASGARILVTLLHEMQKRDVTYGLATLCIGGGMGEAVIVKR